MYYLCICQARVYANETRKNMCARANQNAQVLVCANQNAQVKFVQAKDARVLFMQTMMHVAAD